MSLSPILELQQQRALLQLEYDEEKKAFAALREQRGCERLVARGDAWWPVSVGRSFYNSLNALCIELTCTPPDEDDELDHHFEYGRPVAFFTTDEHHAMLPTAATGTVSYVDGCRMVVALNDDASALALQQPAEGRRVGVALSFDETSYRAMFDALERTIRAKGRLGYLRDLLYTTRDQMKAQQWSLPDMAFPYLNEVQQKAVNQVLRAKDVAIVHGPPGTGKTTTLVEAIYETLRREPQVLVCAQSNMAVDWISERLVDRGVSVLRIGNPARVDDKMLSFTYERRFEAHPDYAELWALRKAMRQLRSQHKRGDSFHQKMDRLKSRATEIEIRINAELFAEARVVACTLVGAGHRLLDGTHFGTLFVDEAAQALEAATWIAIRRAQRVVLAGDHCQLPPTVKSYEALRQGLGRTLMERVAGQRPEVVTLLKMQYRMHEEIMRFSSFWFYHGQVTSAPEVSGRSLYPGDLPITWIDTAAFTSENEQQLGGQSWSNAAEARLTVLALQAYLERIGRRRITEEHIDVGLISPYRAQVQLLRQAIKRNEWLRPVRRQISCGTVDGFQGQERDIIVISLVRQNDDGQIGFLRDLRRMNVAITRARMKLLILGNRKTLTQHPFYRKLWQYINNL